MKVFYLGSNIHSAAVDIVKSSLDSMLIYEDVDVSHNRLLINELEKSDRAVGINRKYIKQNAGVDSNYRLIDREKVLPAVLNDFRLFLLHTRYKRVDFDGAFSNVGYFSDVIDYALRFYHKYSPKIVYCSYTPHTVESWIFARTMEELRVKIVRLIDSPLPWVLLPVVGLLDGKIHSLNPAVKVVDSNKIARYLSLLGGSYASALPYYEKSINWSRFHKFGNLLSLLRPVNLAKWLERLAIRREYGMVKKAEDVEKAFAIYFLHYQPEMNTLPEAGIYCDQYNAIIKLSAALPAGVNLLVKEHPSTFTKRCDRRWRPNGFYDRIMRIPNVAFAASDAEAFNSIDKAIFVASISGVCLTEALARGKIAVAFNPQRFSYFPENFVVDACHLSVSQLTVAIDKIVSQNLKISRDDVFLCFENMAANGYDGSNFETFIPRNASDAVQNSRRANCMVIEDIMNGVIS